MSAIAEIKAREILDSRGNPTVEVDVLLDRHEVFDVLGSQRLQGRDDLVHEKLRRGCPGRDADRVRSLEPGRVHAGRVVKGVNFVGLRDAGDPVEGRLLDVFDRRGKLRHTGIGEEHVEAPVDGRGGRRETQEVTIGLHVGHRDQYRLVGGLGHAVRQVAGLAGPMGFLKFSRDAEREADLLGLEYEYAAGYDPQAFISFFEKVQAQEKKKPGSLAKAFSTHPQTPDRISKSQEEIASILPARAQYTVSTSEFDDVKARLATIENRHKILDKKEDRNKPTLRRTSTPDKNGSDDKGSGDDDRPTLKRRDDSSSN